MKTVAICGSMRFKKEIKNFTEDLKKRGVIVFSPYIEEDNNEWNRLSLQYKKFVALGLTHDHFYKIRIADVVFIYNKDGYVGISTTLEIGYAVGLGKPIYSLSEKDDELFRSILFRGVARTTEELINNL